MKTGLLPGALMGTTGFVVLWSSTTFLGAANLSSTLSRLISRASLCALAITPFAVKVFVRDPFTKPL